MQASDHFLVAAQTAMASLLLVSCYMVTCDVTCDSLSLRLQQKCSHDAHQLLALQQLPCLLGYLMLRSSTSKPKKL